MALATGTRRIALAGNPNTGKTTLFNRLTGSRAKVGNYPGITVEHYHGPMRLPDGSTVEVSDVPGAYALSARSEEEHIALRAIAGLAPLETPDLVIVVVDATQLARNLYFAIQVIELGTPVVIALNMIDLLEATGQAVDADALAAALDVPVVPIAAQRGAGLDRLRVVIGDVLANPDRAISSRSWELGSEGLAADVDAVAAEIPAGWHRGSEGRRAAFARWALLSVDEDDELEGIPDGLRQVVDARRHAADAAGRDLEEEIIRGLYDWIDAHAGTFLRELGRPVTTTDRIDRVLLHPAVGFLIFLALMTVVFQSIFAWADPMIGAIEAVVGWTADAAAALLPAGFFADLVVNGLIEGVGAVLVFLPQILLLFFFLGLLEDTGYMARVAYLMDRVMKAIGLHGRAFVPMLSGYACAVPAILATRTMERRRDRMLTMMVVPLMTCSARLPVYGLLIAALVPVDGSRPFVQGLLLVGMYLFSTVVALVAAAVLGRTVFRGKHVPLLLEIPPYRMPHWPSVLRMMWQKSMVFVREAGTIILACTVGMWLLLSFPSHPTLERDFDALRTEAAAAPDAATRLAELDAEESGARLRASWGGRLGHAIEPAIEPLGFDWKIGIGLIGAFAAREVFVSTMAVVYGLGQDADESSPGLRDRVRRQEWPDGRKVYTPLVCISLMVFFALACQCMSTLAVVKRETNGWRWPVFLFGYMTVLAWMASFVVYQGGRLLGF